MKRFSRGVGVYLTACLILITAVVLRGDGPHPRVLSVYPFNGDQFWPGGTAEISFNQPMDQASVERAVQVSPGTQGQGAWYGNTLNLQPIGDWKPNVTYHVTLTGKVTDDQGRPLQTPVSFWFRVHHVDHLGFCSVSGVRNVCDKTGTSPHPLTHGNQPVLQYALSPDGTTLAYTRRDSTGLPHLFITQVDETNAHQLTFGTKYADSAPWWATGDNSSVSYYRRPATRLGAGPGKARIWNITVDGSGNAPL